MTYYEEDEAVTELRIRMSENGVGEKGGYLRLGQQQDRRASEAEGLPPSPRGWRGCLWYWFKLLLLFTCLGVLAVVCLKWVWPFLMEKKWLEKYPKKASLIRSAGAGNRVHQLRAVALIRISPFPYILYNYCAVATNVKYVPYLLGSLIGVVPEIFIAIYTGLLLKALANASYDRRSLSAPQIVLNVIGFLATVATTVIFTMYAKKQLKILRDEEEQEPLLLE